MFKKIVLKNGLRIITLPQKSTQAVTVLVLVATGSKYEREKRLNGISHFLEHMLFKGTKRRPDKKEIVEVLEKIGGIYNAFTSEEYSGYFAKVKADHFEIALDWVADIFLNSLLPEKEIEKEKGVLIEEINMRYDNPQAYVEILWGKLLYGDQPAGWDIAGTKESIAKISLQDLKNYWQNQYVAQNTIICLAGKIEPNLAIKKVKKYFAKIKTNQALKKPVVIEKQKKPECLLTERKTDQTHLCLGARGYNIFHPQRYSQELLGVILGGMMSSRLFLEVREELGIAYYIKTGVEVNPDTGYLVTEAGIDNKNVDKAVRTILKEYKKISQKKVPQSELKKAKDYTKGTMALLLETSDAQASFFGCQELLKKEVLTLGEIYKKIDQVSQTDILKVAKEIFRPEKLNLALVGPFKDKKPFEKILHEF